MLQAPFPYFGGKKVIAKNVWRALGDCKHYIEPFFGSGAVLLARNNYIQGTHIETVCDKDGFICNVWRALQGDHEEVAKWCDWPVNHADLSARKQTLIKEEPRLLENLIKNPEWYDAKMAGYWIWAASCWIGSGLTCIGQRPHVSTGGNGVHALGKRSIENDGCSDVVKPYNINIYQWFRVLSERLRCVRVVCGDWTRVCGGDWQSKMGICGMFFDPPYGVADRDESLYHHDSMIVAKDVMEWVLERGKSKMYRIVVAGYDEHEDLLSAGWIAEKWSAQGGYGSGKKKGKNVNRKRETLYFSPNCLRNSQKSLF